jgi:hypothetical protein
MENVIDSFFWQENVARNVMLDEGEILVAGEVPDVLEIASDKIIDGNYPVPFRQQPVDQMRSEKTSATRHDRNLLRTRSHVPVFLIRHLKLGERFVILQLKGPVGD